MIERIKLAIRSIMRVLARVLNTVSGGRVTPNIVTLFGLAMHVPIAWLIATQHNFWAAGLLLVFGLFDTLDGELARLQNHTSARGRLLDSVTDRMKEILLYIGAAYAIVTVSGHSYIVAWVVAACGCSLLTSYINAAGDSIMIGTKTSKHVGNKAFRGGLFPFEIRMFILIVGLVCNHLILTVVIIAIGAGYTAISRLFRVMARLTEADVQA